jgi:hypothetical protein
MLEGFSSIGELQKFWEAHEKISLQSEHQQHYQSLIEPLVKLYSLFFAYQAHVICHLSKTQPLRAWRDLSNPKFWTNKLDDINKLSENCCKLIGVSRESEIQENRDSLLQEIQKLRHIEEDIRESKERHTRDEQETRLLQDLAIAAGDYERYKNLNPKRVRGTCEWFLMDERFCKWRDNASSSLLWVSAGPGRGKSVLSRSLIDEGLLDITTITITPSSNEPITSRQSIVCYFFFKDGGDGHMDSAQALCALLYQIFTCPSTSGLIKYALERHRELGRALTEKAPKLWEILLACVAAPDSGEIICVLDALDECKDNSRQELVKTLNEFYSRSARLLTEDSKLKFLVTSRPYYVLESSFEKFPEAVYLRFDGDDKSKEIQKEIDLVIDAKVLDITINFAAKDQQKISKHLKSMKHRTYLWLHLTFDIIEKSPGEYSRRLDIEKLLSRLPSQVSDAYENILSRSTNQSRTRILLQIILAAIRPLTLDEANVAFTLAIREQEPNSHTKVESELWPRENFQRYITNLCGLFISVYDSKLSFIHQTAREFLLDSKQEGNWKGSFDMAQSHNIISRSCLLYLLLPDINGPIEDGNPTQYPYLAYAADFWPLHFVSQKAADANAFRKYARTLCNTTGHQASIWVPSCLRYRHLHWKGWSDLALASYLGLSEVVEDILFKEKPDVDLETENDNNIGRTPLSWAAEGGYEAVVKLLLEKGAEIEAGDDIFGRTPLSLAAEGGHEAVVKLLLKKGAEIEAGDNGEFDSRTPLLWAVGEGHETVVKLLLENGAEIEAKDRGEFGRTPLSWAAGGGYEIVVELLLEKGAEIEAKDRAGRTPLWWAAGRGHEIVVKLLLGRG